MFPEDYPILTVTGDAGGSGKEISIFLSWIVEEELADLKDLEENSNPDWELERG